MGWDETTFGGLSALVGDIHDTSWHALTLDIYIYIYRSIAVHVAVSIHRRVNWDVDSGDSLGSGPLGRYAIVCAR